MRMHHFLLIGVASLTSVWEVAMSAETQPGQPINTGQIEQLTGLKGSFNKEEGVFRVTVPRSDVPISVDGWKMPPFMGLTSWAAFTQGKKAEAMVMGDLVLMQDEVNSVMSAALDAGLSVTALHNHFFYDEPKVYFMHIGGEGPIEKLAAGVKTALDKVKEVRTAAPEPEKSFGKPFAPEKNAITGADIERRWARKASPRTACLKLQLAGKLRCLVAAK
jgi:Domain of Unknown Function (DUF1259)